MTTLLVELFTEELPPKALGRLGKAFAEELHKGLATRGLAAAKSAVTVYATPRRLAAAIADVSEKGSDSKVEKKLMPAKVAFDAGGSPSASLQKRLEKEGATAADVQMRKEGDADFAWLSQSLAGATLKDGLQAALTEAITKLPIPKVMRYQPDGAAWTDPFIEFVRPAHGLVALYGDKVVEVSALGLNAGRVTHGHRFQGAKDVSIKGAESYAQQLRDEGAVIASFEERSNAIRAALEAAAKKEGANLGAAADVDALLDEVTALVERPAIYTGEFEAEFLAVPQECLILTMRLNQKYFPLFDAAGKLKNRFLIVSNMQLDDAKNIIEGNQRVVRPRLSDAKFFFDFDRREKLESRLAALDNVVYHNKLGSQGDPSSAWSSWPARLPIRSSSTPPRRNAPRAWPRPTWSPTWWASSPSCRASWAATTRRTTRKTPRSPRRSRSTTCRALPATRCRRPTPVPAPRWPTSSIRWRAFSPSA